MEIKKREWEVPIVATETQINSGVDNEVKCGIVVAAKIKSAKEAREVLDKLTESIKEAGEEDINLFKSAILAWDVKFLNPEKHHIVRNSNGDIVTLTGYQGKKITEFQNEEVLDILIDNRFSVLVKNILLTIIAEATGSRIPKQI